MKKYSLINVTFLLIIPIILGIFWFRHGNIMGTGESGLPFYDLKRLFEIVSHAWATPLLGGSIGIQVAAVPTDWLLSQLQSLGIPPFVIQASFFTFLFIVAGFAVHLLTQELFPNLKKKYTLLAVWFYWFNPISLVSAWNRFLYNYMAFWALLPLSLWLFLKGLKSRDYRFAFFAALSTVIFSYALTAIAFNVLIIFTFIYTFLFFFFKGLDKGFCVKYFLTFLVSFVLFNFWWIGQLFSFISSSSYSGSVSKYFTSADNLSTLQALSERLGSLSYVFAFLHYDFFASGPPWAQLFVSPPLLFLNLLVMASILWVIFKFRKLKEVVFLGLLLTVVIFLMKGVNPPFGEIFRFIFLKYPPLQVFRNPFEKFSFLLPLAAAPLFGLAIESLMHLVKVRILKFFVWIFVLGIMGFWAYPFWTGLAFTGDEIRVPDYYKEANNWLKSQGDNFRFVSLPLGGEGITYTWDKSYSGVELSSTLFDTPNISFNTSLPYFSEIASNLTKYELDKRILKYLPFINGKYIVWRDDVDFKGRKMANPSVVKDRLDQLVKDGLINLKYNGKNLIIYELNDEPWPKIYISNNLVWSNENDLSNFESYNNLFNEKFAIVNSQNVQTDNIFIKPAKVISSFDRNQIFPHYAFPNKENYSWVVYQFEVPYKNKYKIQLSNEKDKLIHYFDGEKITGTNDKGNTDNYFIISEGLHEFALAGEGLDFLTTVVSIDKLHIAGDNRYTFDLPKTPKDYLIQFEYIPSSENILTQSNTFAPFVFEDVSNPNDPIYIPVLPNNDSRQSQSWIGYYSSTPGATTAGLSFLPLGQNVCTQSLFGSRNCKLNVGKLNIEVNNLKVSQLNIPDVHLVTQQRLVNYQYKTSLDWEKVNPTLYHVKINKQDSQPEVLVFSELFDSGWKINGQSSKLDISKHILVNSYANGWLLEKMGKYEVDIEFMPERLLNIGKFVSGSAIALGLIILFFTKLTWRKPK